MPADLPVRWIVALNVGGWLFLQLGLAWLFTRLLLLSEERGPHATGAAWLDADGGHRLFKRPVTAERFVM